MARIALLTDFGTRDPYVAAMKGVIASRTDAPIHDLSHEIAPFDVLGAAWFVSAVVKYWPAATIFVCVIDPGVGTARNIIALEHEDRILLAPDNGLLAPLAVRKKIDCIIRIDPTRLVQYGVSDVSATFHGRDVFAPLAAAIAAGRCDPVDLGEEVDSLDQSGWPATTARADGGVAGVVVAVDRFGNLISNIEATAVVALNSPTVHVGGLRLPLRRTYGDAAPGEYLGLINSFEVLEVARSRGNAAVSAGRAPGCAPG